MYVLPTFNLTCDIYTNPAGGPWVIRATVPCNLAYSKRVNFMSWGNTFPFAQPAAGMSLLLPALTDIRMVLNLTGQDFVVVPAGSGRWYQVQSVDDAGKGFANEHRVAMLIAIGHPITGLWPTPIP